MTPSLACNALMPAGVLAAFLQTKHGFHWISLDFSYVQVYDLFDDILLLSEGHIVFHGPREEVRQMPTFATPCRTVTMLRTLLAFC